MIKVAVMGYGTIGSGVVEIIEKNQDILFRQTGGPVEVKYVLDLREFPGTSIQNKVVHDLAVIEQDPEVSIVVETMGGTNPAFPFVKRCLEAGKHVTTSNKALVAAHGTELLAVAADHNVNFFFEASVGGGIPIVRNLSDCLVGEKIESITGILNGTTNYILTKMDVEGESFDTALKEAQDLGYAERNPEADVEGHDTCRKIAILTALATGKEVNYEDIYTEGITKITDIDFAYAEKLGASVKLLGSSQMTDGKVSAYVAPVLIGKKNPLYAVSDVYNGISVRGNMLGNAMFYGSGAGKLPTASAVIADIIGISKHASVNVPVGWTSERQEIAPMETTSHRYFLRMSGTIDAVRADLREIYETGQVVILEGMDEFAILTEVMVEKEFMEKRAALEKVLEEKHMEIRQMIRADL